MTDKLKNQDQINIFAMAVGLNQQQAAERLAAMGANADVILAACSSSAERSKIVALFNNLSRNAAKATATKTIEVEWDKAVTVVEVAEVTEATEDDGN